AGRRGWTAIGGQPSGEDSSTPSPDSACSSGPIGRRWKYFWPTIVTGAVASEARPVRKYRVVPELPTETSGRDGVQGPPPTMNVSPSTSILMPRRRRAWIVYRTWPASDRFSIRLGPWGGGAGKRARWG